MLKKFLKALVPPDAAETPVVDVEPSRSESPNSDVSGHSCGDDNGNDEKTDSASPQEQDSGDEKKAAIDLDSIHPADGASSAAQMSRKPGEVAFFKLLNSELKKSIHFFDKAQLEFEIREERVREGIDIMRKANSLMVNEKWTLMAKSLYRLYKDLLLLETYAIMTYCSFSKILKKHDKVTKHTTRVAFMMNVVNKANFTDYPKLLEMINRCERLYDEVSRSLILEGKSGLYEDERLFINMIHRLNEQVLDTAETEGAPEVDVRKEHRRSSFTPDHPPPNRATGGEPSPAASSRSSISSDAQVSTLRSLVEENAMNKSSKEGLARVAESEQAISATVSDEKLPALQVTEGQALAEPTIADTEGGKRSLLSSDSETATHPSTKRARSEQ